MIIEKLFNTRPLLLVNEIYMRFLLGINNR